MPRGKLELTWVGKDRLERRLGPGTLASLKADLDAGRAFVAALTEADLVQETAKAKKLGTTREHNAVRRRIETAVDRIRGAGILHFHDAPSTAARFAALVPVKRKGAGSGDEPPELKESQKGA